MAFDLVATISVLRSHASASGWFAQVTGHEPKSAPVAGQRLTAGFWLQEFTRALGQSGLASTTVLVDMRARLYANALQEPQDPIDLGLGMACVDFMGRISSDFDLGGNVRNVDLGGQVSPGLRMQMGWLDQDGKKLRVATVSIPCIVNDVWEQSA